jgi:hypothetical protein
LGLDSRDLQTQLLWPAEKILARSQILMELVR